MDKRPSRKAGIHVFRYIAAQFGTACDSLVALALDSISKAHR
jgi:hypothetical protein